MDKGRNWLEENSQSVVPITRKILLCEFPEAKPAFVDLEVLLKKLQKKWKQQKQKAGKIQAFLAKTCCQKNLKEFWNTINKFAAHCDFICETESLMYSSLARNLRNIAIREEI